MMMIARWIYERVWVDEATEMEREKQHEAEESNE